MCQAPPTELVFEERCLLRDWRNTHMQQTHREQDPLQSREGTWTDEKSSFFLWPGVLKSLKNFSLLILGCQLAHNCCVISPDLAMCFLSQSISMGSAGGRQKPIFCLSQYMILCNFVFFSLFLVLSACSRLALFSEK